MPWTCPACRTPIHHADSEQRPRTGVTYRCHICRLELVVDIERNHLVLAPLATGQLEHTGDSIGAHGGAVPSDRDRSTAADRHKTGKR